MSGHHLFETAKQPDLVYDVGMHEGEDSEFYLRKGFRVVAVEANPDLVERCRERLADFIARQRLTIVEGAIPNVDLGDKAPEQSTFFKDDVNTGWGTVDAGWADRNTRVGAMSRTIEVRTIDFASVLREHGVPHYLKIDIEGADLTCVRTLRLFKSRPDYVSIESDKTSFRAIREEIDLFVELGYDAFQAIDQSSLPRRQSPPVPAREGSYVAHRFELGSSGLFGRELNDDWYSRGAILRRYLAIRLGYFLFGDEGILSESSLPMASMLNRRLSRILSRVTGGEVPGWYDTHARLRSVASRSPQ